MTDRSGRPEVPFRLTLEQQKKRAKDLLRALRAGEPAALARWHAQLSKAPIDARLADAQFVIARELGSPSWTRLRAHAAAMERERAAIAGRTPAPDEKLRTLHIRCGSDIRPTLVEAGFIGDFLEHSDPYCQGPVPNGPDLLSVRARFLAEAYGEFMELSATAIAEKLRREETALAQAAVKYERVVLWCEHDSYDQLTLVRCLAQFEETGAPAVLELISINHFPGAIRFIGLGQLPPEALRMLWPTRRALTTIELAVGRRAWNALRSDDPHGLADIAHSAIDGLPDLARALRRHLRELPWISDGLSLTERLILQLIEAEPLTVGQVYTRLMLEREPLPWLSDVMFLELVRAMAKAREPAFRILDKAPEVRWPQWRLEITAEGRAILRGDLDWLALEPPERWIGGVRIRAGVSTRRWDEARCRPTGPLRIAE
jgi:hypothetical protein